MTSVSERRSLCSPDKQTHTHTHTEPTAVANPRLRKRTHDIFDGTA